MFGSNSETKKQKDIVRQHILLSIPIISLSASAMHFVYAVSGKIAVIGLLAPVNESIWEHQKLAFIPMLVWWTAAFFAVRKKTEVSALRWFYSGAAAQLICPLFIISFYYLHTGALGLHSILLDVSSLFIGVILGQIGGLHTYRYSRLNRFWLSTIFLAVAVLFTAYIAFTVFPPHLPLFMDTTTGNYGM
jgi:succinate dehydrogenase hydrophobic anchor subunit